MRLTRPVQLILGGLVLALPGCASSDPAPAVTVDTGVAGDVSVTPEPDGASETSEAPTEPADADDLPDPCDLVSVEDVQEATGMSTFGAGQLVSGDQLLLQNGANGSSCVWMTDESEPAKRSSFQILIVRYPSDEGASKVFHSSQDSASGYDSYVPDMPGSDAEESFGEIGDYMEGQGSLFYTYYFIGDNDVEMLARANLLTGESLDPATADRIATLGAEVADDVW